MKVLTPQQVKQYQKHYSEPKLFSKIGKVCKRAGVKGVYNALLLFYLLKDKNTSLEHKAIIVGALGYFILPVDLIPDIIPALGLTDDLATLVACIKTIKANITPLVKENASKKLSEWFADADCI